VTTETDTAFLLRVLSDGRPHTLNEILGLSFRDRGCGLTVHSRAADLRKQGHNVLNEQRRGRGYRTESVYQLGPTVEEAFGPGETHRIPREAA